MCIAMNHTERTKKKQIYILFFVLIFVLMMLMLYITYRNKTNISYLTNDSILNQLTPLSNSEITQRLFIADMRLNETLACMQDLKQSYSTDSEECSLVFTMSAAHSGNRELFSALDKLNSSLTTEYRMLPDMSGMDLLKVKSFGLSETYCSRKQKKIRAIENSMNSNAWIDTSHLFIESWYDVALDYFVNTRGCDVTVIVLKRYLPHVIHDILKDDFLNKEATLYHSWHSKTAILPELPTSSERVRQIDNIIWYILDTEQIIERVKKQYDIAFVDIRIEELNSTAVLDFLNIGSVSLSLDSTNDEYISGFEEEMYVDAVNSILEHYENEGVSLKFDSSVLRKIKKN